MRERAPAWRRLAGLAVAALLAACATPAERFDQRAAALGLSPLLLHGDGFVLRSYVAGMETAETTLHVYVEHDGTPWATVDRVAADPTPRTPYALELMAKDTGPRLMLGRPCYFEVQAAPPCSPLLWTHGRYSMRVVSSMVTALRNYLSVHPYRQLVFIGYSGGGTLAWLMAAQVPQALGVVTIAANLDTDVWARSHGYSPLAGSLNPSLEPVLAERVAEYHYVGGRDANVQPSVVRAFARGHPAARVIEIAEFDHVCCWIEKWPQLLSVLDR